MPQNRQDMQWPSQTATQTYPLNHHQRFHKKLQQPSNVIQSYTRRRVVDPDIKLPETLYIPQCLSSGMMPSAISISDTKEVRATDNTDSNASLVKKADKKTQSIAAANARLHSHYLTNSEPVSEPVSESVSIASTSVRTFVTTKPVSSLNKQPTIVKHVIGPGVSIPDAVKAVKSQQKVLFGMARVQARLDKQLQ
ncbi:hypothetical protein RTP6_003685 [Batrachochytrium dendrobatidis]